MVSFPIDIVLGPLTLSSHLLFEVLAFIVGFQYYLHLKGKSKDPLNQRNRLAVLLGAIIGALVFSRLIGALERPGLFFDPPSLLFYYQSKTIVGGIVGGLIGVEITKKIIGEKHSSGDLFTYPLILAIMIGRIGCALTGVTDGTVGIESNLPWAFDQGDGVPRHPTALYEIGFLGLTWLGLIAVQKKHTLQNGSIFKLFMVSYLTFRLFVEFIKPITPLAIGLSAIQLTCLVTLLYYSTAILSKGLLKK